MRALWIVEPVGYRIQTRCVLYFTHRAPVTLNKPISSTTLALDKWHLDGGQKSGRDVSHHCALDDIYGAASRARVSSSTPGYLLFDLLCSGRRLFWARRLRAIVGRSLCGDGREKEKFVTDFCGEAWTKVVVGGVGGGNFLKKKKPPSVGVWWGT